MGTKHFSFMDFLAIHFYISRNAWKSIQASALTLDSHQEIHVL